MGRNEGRLIGGRNDEAVGGKERRGRLSGKELWDCLLWERASREAAVRKERGCIWGGNNESVHWEERATSMFIVDGKGRWVYYCKEGARARVLTGRSDEIVPVPWQERTMEQ